MNINYLKKHKWQALFILIGVVAVWLLLFDFNRFISIVNWISGVFKPLVIGGCIAFTLNLLMLGLNKILFNRIHFKTEQRRDSVCLLASVVLLLVIVILLLWFIIPQLIQSFRLLIESIPGALNYLRNLLNDFLQRYPGIEANIDSLPFKLDDIVKNVVSYLQNFMSDTFNQTYNVAANAIGLLFTTFIGVMFSFFLLLYKQKLGRQCRQLLFSYLPEKVANQTLYVFHLAYKDFNAFIYGQVIGAVIQFAIYLVISLIFRVPYALMISVMIMIFSLIPMFGSYIAYILGVLLIISVNPIQAITFSVIFFVAANVEGNLIYPRIMGSSLGLPGIWVLAAVTLGGNMFGLVGMVFSVPVTAVIYTLLSENSQKRLLDKRDLVPRINKAPNWSYYNYRTGVFESKPPRLGNVLEEKVDADGREVDSENSDSDKIKSKDSNRSIDKPDNKNSKSDTKKTKR